MKFENTHVYNLVNAIYSARNPLESWGKSDSDLNNGVLGENDLKLAQRLIGAGAPDRKFMRQIFVSVDITAPLYFFKEFDTYKVGTVSNSTSTMHRLATTPITLDCFEMDDYDITLEIYDCEPFKEDVLINDVWDDIVNACETLRKRCLETKDKRYWKELIRILPESWLQKRTVTMNYENIYSMIRQRRYHKLNEWSGRDDSTKTNFIAWAKTLPYAKELLFYGLN